MFAHSPKIVTDGLVLSLDAGNTKSYPGTGTTWFDKSGFSNNGTLTNGPTFNTGSLGSIVFDGTNDYVNCATNITLGSSFTINAFIYINLRSSGDIAGSWNNPYRFLWRLDNSGYQVLAWNNGGPSNTVTGTTIVSTGTWNYISVTYDGTNVKFYNNTVLTDTIAKSFSISNFTAMQVGANTYDNVYFNGRIASTQVHNRALTQAEITQNFNALRGRFGI